MGSEYLQIAVDHHRDAGALVDINDGTDGEVVSDHRVRGIGKIVAHEMAEETLAEIDTLTDWQIVEGLAAAKFKDAPRAWGF